MGWKNIYINSKVSKFARWKLIYYESKIIFYTVSNYIDYEIIIVDVLNVLDLGIFFRVII